MNKKMIMLLAPEGAAAPATATPTPAEPTTTALGAEEPVKEPVKETPPGEKKPDAAAPADIEIKLPEGVTMDEAILGKFKPLAKEFGLDSAKAQKLVDLQIEALNAHTSKADAAWQETRTGWQDAAKKDAEYGGVKFAENVKIAQVAIEKFGGPELKKALNDFGLGDHPEVIRFAYRVGKAISEDSIKGITATPATQDDSEAKLREAFPSMYK